MTKAVWALAQGFVSEAALATQIRQSISDCRNQIVARGPFEDAATGSSSNLFKKFATSISGSWPDANGAGEGSRSKWGHFPNRLLGLVADRVHKSNFLAPAVAPLFRLHPRAY